MLKEDLNAVKWMIMHFDTSSVNGIEPKRYDPLMTAISETEILILGGYGGSRRTFTMLSDGCIISVKN